VSTVSGLVKLMRPRQWIKNGFVLAPLVVTGRLLEPEAVSAALVAMLLFCLASSMAYIVNDLNDIEADRRHPSKRDKRPLASGEISPLQARLLLVVLLLVLLSAYPLAAPVLHIIALYLAINLAYSLKLKHLPVVDIFSISIGFVLRVYAGAVALSVPVSGWMFITTFSLALFLASVKRRQELIAGTDGTRPVLERYTVPLINRFAEMAGVMAILSYSLFAVTVKPELVYSVPLVLFGIYRYWFIVETEGAGESPTDALIADHQLKAIVIIWIAYCGWQIAA
jgi:decaprenyl-phosphate phosphoribosyltransferase